MFCCMSLRVKYERHYESCTSVTTSHVRASLRVKYERHYESSTSVTTSQVRASLRVKYERHYESSTSVTMSQIRTPCCKLIDLLCTNCVQQHVNEPTTRNNILDLAMTTPDLRIIGLEVTDNISDHQMIASRSKSTTQAKV
ncbi:hypothetical protein FHG87_023107 [Trinorchestia longiramus]|nr:hypothetical protein FHG87_023107 [Trinorchestia longiramus]